ncbi:hypothetical protein F5Y16DRAFT_371877 [Xylariaceae sp. FL0255]|nr:hypothetical protein F5Y16DRAFT_371877 [Xylariaceae sp. FL0255]
MRRWFPRGRSIVRASHKRTSRLSTVATGFYDAERVHVPVGSSGHVSIDLHNLAKVSSSEPLLIYLPPFSAAAPSRNLAALPKFAQRYGTAVINYRWTEDSFEQRNAEPNSEEAIAGQSFHPGWPAPIHDTLNAYSWIVENLTPRHFARRDIFVYGSYLGASLATSLSLTECIPHERTAIRGCIAYNGVYNWTMFLPDHPVNHRPLKTPQNILEEILYLPGGHDFGELQQMARELFRKPDNFFDPFASSCLLFHTPGLLVPPSFDESAIPVPSPLIAATEAWFSAEEPAEMTALMKQPRKSHLVFPPRKSMLKIPEMLLLHDTPPPLPPSLLRRRQRRTKKSYGNSFGTQAEELAGLMRRSINKVELKERLKWDEDFDESDDEANRRVQVFDVGSSDVFQGTESGVNNVAATWLADRTYVP